MLIEVSFKGNRREFFEWPFEDAPAVRTPVIVEVERGEDLGRVHATGDLAVKRKNGTTHGKASSDPLKKAVRAANGDEIARATQLRDDEKNVRTRAIEKVRALGLDLKVSDTEWQLDKKRLTVYFTAEQRVDFRQLVRQLEGLFGTRVHMWHIGVRDEAKRVDGVGRCGRQLCSASWLPELVPVKSSVAKDQHLSTLNPAQISGACGRLMCCLRYEHEFYVQQRKRFPKEGKIVKTPAGEEKVVSLDIFRETVTLRAMGGETRIVPLTQLQREASGQFAVVEAEPAEIPSDEEEESFGETAEYAVVQASRADAPRRMPEEREAPPPERPRDESRDRAGEQRRAQPRDQRGEKRRDERRAQQRPQDQPRAEPRSENGEPQPGGEAQQQGGGGRRRRRGRRGGRRGRGGPGGSSGPPQEPGGSPPSPQE